MKLIKNLSAVAFAISIVASPLAGSAADTNAPAKGADKKADLRPYKLEKCIVSDEKLGEMGKPFVAEYKGQEIKFCCKGCKKDFDKNPDKFIKKMQEAEKKAPAKPAEKDPHAGHNH